MCQRMWCTCEVVVVLLVAAATLNRKTRLTSVDINGQNLPITGCTRSWYSGMMYWKQFLQAPITHLSKVTPPPPSHPEVFTQLFLSMRSLRTILEPGTGYVDSLDSRYCGFQSLTGFLIECFHMASRRPYWCSKTINRRPCWCPKPILWELNSFLMHTPSFVLINLHRCQPREWERSIP